MKKTASELRALVRQSRVQPVRIYMRDGKIFTILSPDLALVGNSILVLAKSPGVEIGELSFVLCDFDQIARIETLAGTSRNAA